MPYRCAQADRQAGMLSEFWAWLSTQPQGAASFLGTVTGSFLGLVALLAGALFNAHLSRRRDDRLRRIEARAVAASLTTELRQFEDILLRNADGLAQAN